MVNVTEWMGEQGKNFTLVKLHKMEISVGYPGVSAPQPSVCTCPTYADGTQSKILKPDSLAEHYSGAEVHYGKDTWHLEDDSPNAAYSLRRPDKRTHLHDYFNLERGHVKRAWMRLRRAPRPDE